VTAGGDPAEELGAEGTGETVGEAKWAALRELEQRHPGLDKGAVRFQVVSEGERGLLGVGFEPARVVATVDRDALASIEAVDESAPAGRALALVSRIARELGVPCTVSVEEREQEILVTCEGPDLGLLIGKHGQTIDAIQYLVNAIVLRANPAARRDVVVDAAGYRARRRATLETLALRTAERVRVSGRPEELEPMTAVERKIVHIYLKDAEGIETTSEGSEPNRYVVVLPAGSAASDAEGARGA
jgi:spoIIIJ-associated protein